MDCSLSARKGVYGAIFSRLNILWSKKIRQGTWVGRHPIIEVMLVGSHFTHIQETDSSQVTTLTTLVSFLNPYCRMGGTELVASVSSSLLCSLARKADLRHSCLPSAETIP